MKSTLAERLKIAMTGPPKVSGKALAEACGVKPPSVSDWLSGKTKTIEASNLLAAARFLRVRPEWLANGIGHEYETGALNQTPAAREPDNMLHLSQRDHTTVNWPFRRVTPHQYGLLDETEIEAIENNILLLIRAHGDHTKQNSPATRNAA